MMTAATSERTANRGGRTSFLPIPKRAAPMLDGTPLIARRDAGQYHVRLLSGPYQSALFERFGQETGGAVPVERSVTIAAGAEVAEWQTRRSQTPLRATSCGFESHLRYHGPRGFVGGRQGRAPGREEATHDRFYGRSRPDWLDRAPTAP